MYNVFGWFTVQNAVTLVHGPQGCISSAFGINYFTKGKAKWYSTDLTEMEVILGGEEKLREALILIDKQVGPEVIFIYTSCVSGIIGDDIASVVKQTQPEIGARLIPVVCEGFKKQQYHKGTDSAYQGIISYLLEDVQEDQTLVNVITSLSVNQFDVDEITRILSSIGLTPNFIPCFATLDNIRKSASAKATIPISHSFNEYFVNYLNNKHNVQPEEYLIPQSVGSTDRWLIQLAKMLNRSTGAKTFIEQEHRKIEPDINALKAALSGKRIFVGANLTIAESIGELSNDFGFEIIGLKDYLKIKGTGTFDQTCFTDLANILHFEQANVLRYLKPDLYLTRGLSIPYASVSGVPTVSIFDNQCANLGYRGAINMGKRMANALKNTNFHTKLAQHVSLPYQPAWYDQYAFKFLSPENKNCL